MKGNEATTLTLTRVPTRVCGKRLFKPTSALDELRTLRGEVIGFMCRTGTEKSIAYVEFRKVRVSSVHVIEFEFTDGWMGPEE